LERLISLSLYLSPHTHKQTNKLNRYETLEESKANGEKNKCGENWSLEEKTDSACAYFCQMDEFPMVDPTADDDDDDDDKNETVVMNSVEVWATTENQNDVAVTLSLDILLGNEWVMIIHLPPIEMDIHTSFVAHDAFDLSNAALQEPKLARGWTDQTLVVNQTFNLVVNSALEVNMTQWHADRMAEIVEASVCSLSLSLSLSSVCSLTHPHTHTHSRTHLLTGTSRSDLSIH